MGESLKELLIKRRGPFKKNGTSRLLNGNKMNL